MSFIFRQCNPGRGQVWEVEVPSWSGLEGIRDESGDIIDINSPYSSSLNVLADLSYHSHFDTYEQNTVNSFYLSETSEGESCYCAVVGSGRH